ncbi:MULTISPECIES: hypothetical protein [unclassified Pseudomonas]|uniref:hypothetical protein n=1 Tax=unclassified Pseudomonas TaxID=196821 RepID=UPI0007308687|nr:MULTISPECIES: hypothetical protein [unclassified Pseudomonas]KSW22637.1 hypothetical protein AOX63_04215 [Pseudomonas sp. ADP]OBP11387.1 hypothetical protein BAE52_09760 [Pseudomonas sp. EGD-AKN5]QOF85454.1 hypothetical protein IG194_01660 [Pseudomonas sp. ADPe]
MSEVKRLNFTVSQFDNVVPYASEHGRYVRYADYAKLEAEAQALRDQVKALQSDASSYQSGYDEGRRMGTKHRQSEVEQLTREVEALRARVVVVPDVTGYWDGLYPAQLRAPHGGPVGFYTIPMVRTDELARINGKVVSEGLLRRITADPVGGAVYDAIAELRDLLGEGKEHD